MRQGVIPQARRSTVRALAGRRVQPSRASSGRLPVRELAAQSQGHIGEDIPSVFSVDT